MQACPVTSVAYNSATQWTRTCHRLLCPWDSPGQNTGVSRHALLQGIFPTQGLNLRLLNWQGGFFTTSASWEAQIKNVVYLYNEILLSHKREWNNAIRSNRDGPRECLSKSGERQIPNNITYMWNLKEMTQINYLKKRNRSTDIWKKLRLPKKSGENKLRIWA